MTCQKVGLLWNYLSFLRKNCVLSFVKMLNVSLIVFFLLFLASCLEDQRRKLQRWENVDCPSLSLFYSLSLSLSLFLFLSNDVFFFELFEHVNLTYFLCVLILNPVYLSIHSRHLFCCLVAAENETRPGSLIKCPSACVCVCVCVCGCVGVCVCACVCVSARITQPLAGRRDTPSP